MADGRAVHYPELMPVETVSVIRRLVRLGAITATRGDEAVTDLRDLSGQRHRHDTLLAEVYRLSGRFTAYDAVYVALAGLLDATLVTLDRRLARQAGTLVSVHVPD